MGEPLYLQPHQRLRTMRPDVHVRRRNGQHLGYVCEDKYGGQVIVAQKLSDLAGYICDQVTLAADQITATSLYKILKVKDGHGRTGGWAKNRWRCRAFELSQAVDQFESLRVEYSIAVVLGSPRCYHIGVVK